MRLKLNKYSKLKLVKNLKNNKFYYVNRFGQKYFNRHPNFNISELFKIKKFINYVEIRGKNVSLYFENEKYILLYSLRSPILEQKRLGEQYITYEKCYTEDEDYANIIN